MENFIDILNQPWFYIIFMTWSIVWKGLALWKAATKKQLIWFTLILVFNTIGIVEILYIFFFNKWDIDNGQTLKFLEKKFPQKKK